MAWTYDIELLTNKDRVRLYIGDVIELDPQLSDEEITALLAIHGGVQATSVVACRMLAARYARYADKWVGDLKILASQKHEAYLHLADILESAGASGDDAGVGIFAGGIRISQKEALDADTDRVMPSFRRRLMDNEEC